ncbi:hypothetical protein ULMS_07860 [Patiriisocius marinistellae]|uniref:TonB C-terminal domain-containing protein n=1 Tax=Patiriisocius marinistellae TaxID=2494560 RepID=A0A5J4FVK1_9FLAO|nr:energy transducer TonB [Patiriisocius marinistellae]GEQ85278.1 hypothetical protein ULMS_07860 [Patiriisocius marinistellae]
MKSSSNNVESNQPKMLSKREEKKQINRKLPSGIFFQIGLIVSLLAVIFLMETTIGYNGNLPGPRPDNLELDPPTMTYVVEKAEVTKPIAKVEKHKPVITRPVITTTLVVKPDENIIETKPMATIAPTPTNTQPKIVTDPKVKPIDTSITKNVNSVEFAPIFPGCESLNSNDERKECMSSKISAFISRRFNSDDFKNLKKDETHKIWVQFKIDTQGNVIDVVARAPQKDMQEEGVRVLSKLPQMTPGKMGKTNVNVSYMVPINFKVQ